MKRFISKKIVAYIVCLLILGCVHVFYAQSVLIQGDSMAPTLIHNERGVILKNSQLERFDIVTFPAPDESGNKYVKRIIGLPGDHIEFRMDQLYINGEKVLEPYLDKFKEELADDRFFTEDFIIDKVPEGHFFVMGDNRRISRDSRSLGPIAKETLEGKVRFVYWPFSKLQSIKN